jgi:hypothetical protein
VPRYVNKLQFPIYHKNIVFPTNIETATLNVLKTQASVLSTLAGTYTITLGVDDTLLLRFNDEVAWTTVTLTAGAAVTTDDVVTDINTAYGSTIAYNENEYIRIKAPVQNNLVSTIYIATTGTTADTILGFSTDDVNPLDQCCFQVFVISTNSETYNIDATNNTFIFKFNHLVSWITATLTIGTTQTAADIAYDINYAYEELTGDSTKVAFAVTPITGGNTYIKLVAPIFNNFESKIYIKSTGNTALTVLGFSGNNYSSLIDSKFPGLVKTTVLPLFNPILKEETLTFSGAGTQYFYLTDYTGNKKVSFFRVDTANFTVYIEDASNSPPFTLEPDETFNMLLTNNITKFIVTADAAGSIFIREFLE